MSDRASGFAGIGDRTAPIYGTRGTNRSSGGDWHFHLHVTPGHERNSLAARTRYTPHTYGFTCNYQDFEYPGFPASAARRMEHGNITEIYGVQFSTCCRHIDGCNQQLRNGVPPVSNVQAQGAHMTFGANNAAPQHAWVHGQQQQNPRMIPVPRLETAWNPVHQQQATSVRLQMQHQRASDQLLSYQRNLWDTLQQPQLQLHQGLWQVPAMQQSNSRISPRQQTAEHPDFKQEHVPHDNRHVQELNQPAFPGNRASLWEPFRVSNNSLHYYTAASQSQPLCTDRKYFCSVQTCNKHFKSWDELKNHRMTHRSKQKFRCWICHKEFFLTPAVFEEHLEQCNK